MYINHKPNKIFSVQKSRRKISTLDKILLRGSVGLSAIVLGATLSYSLSKTPEYFASAKKTFSNYSTITNSPLNPEEPILDLTKKEKKIESVEPIIEKKKSLGEKIIYEESRRSNTVQKPNISIKPTQNINKRNLDDLALVQYKKGEINHSTFLTYERSKKYLPEINKIEKVIKLDLKSLIGAESDFNPNLVSKAGAYGLAQLMKGTVKYTNDRMALDKKILYTLLDPKKLDSLKISNYTTDTKNLDLALLGATRTDLDKITKAYEISENDIKEVIIPRYLKSKELFPNYSIDINKTRNDPNYNIRVGGLILLSNHLELSSKRLVKTGSELKYVTCSRQTLENNPKFQAFNIIDSYAAYNAGVNNPLKLCKQEAEKGRFGTHQQKYYAETKTHKKRVNEYYRKFADLEKRGLLAYNK